MIVTRMRTYPYSSFGALDAYGQPTLSQEPVGEVKMAIHIASQSVSDTIRYSECEYTGVTLSQVDDSMVIHYGDERLKVLYVNTHGRYNVCYMRRM